MVVIWKELKVLILLSFNLIIMENLPQNQEKVMTDILKIILKIIIID